MYLKSIHLKDFRCFKELDADLNPRLNVIVGVNGAGKTAFLQACRIAIASVLNGLPFRLNEQVALMSYDLRYDYDSKHYKRQDLAVIDFEFDAPYLKNSRSFNKAKQVKWSFSVSGDIKKWSKSVKKDISTGNKVDLPALLYLGADRFKVERKDYGEPAIGERYRGYFNSMNGKSATYIFESWFKKMEISEFQNDRQNLGKDFSQLELLRTATSSFYPNAERLYYDTEVEQLVLLLKNGERKPLHDLSDGERFMLLTCITIAFQCILLNPHHDKNALQETGGIVLIDEIDMHLHPAWQREILGKLTKTFPKIQFIVTTHSPQVISSIRRNELFVLSNYQINHFTKYNEGRDSNSILIDVFGDSGRPFIYQKKLDDFYTLLEDQKITDAEELISQLKEVWGDNDPAVLRAEFFLNDAKEDL
ncbi:MAG: AAA family ATPase [Bacteroidia bacterium]